MLLLAALIGAVVLVAVGVVGGAYLLFVLASLGLVVAPLVGWFVLDRMEPGEEDPNALPPEAWYRFRPAGGSEQQGPGSRMDVFLPTAAELTVAVGQRVTGGETVIATLGGTRAR